MAFRSAEQILVSFKARFGIQHTGMSNRDWFAEIFGIKVPPYGEEIWLEFPPSTNQYTTGTIDSDIRRTRTWNGSSWGTVAGPNNVPVEKLVFPLTLLTGTNNQSWMALTPPLVSKAPPDVTVGDRLTDFIRFTDHGKDFMPRIFWDDGSGTGPGTEITTVSLPEQWLFDASSGLLLFGADNSDVFIPSGNTPVWIQAYRYIGQKGVSGGGGTGDVVGPAGSTNNALTVWDGASGKLVKDSSAILTGGSLDLTAVVPDYIDFDTAAASPPYLRGRMYYDSDDECLVYRSDISDVTICISREGLVRVVNNSGAQIDDGTPVYVSGGSGGLSTIEIATANTYAESRLLGVVTHDLPDGNEGLATLWGDVNDLNTDSYSEGDKLYLGTTGGFTTTRPTGGDYTVMVAIVVTKHATTGRIFVLPSISEFTAENLNALGWADDNQATLTFSEVTRELSITPVAASFRFYQGGRKYEKTSDSIIVTDVEGLHLIYYDEGVLIQMHNPSGSQLDTIILTNPTVGYVYWDAINNKCWYLGNEKHPKGMSAETHRYLHFTRGGRWITGLSLTDIVADGSGNLDTSAQFGIEAGIHTDENLPTFPSIVLSIVGTPVYHLEGTEASPIARVDINPGFSLVTTGTGRLAFNQLSAGTWTVQEVSNNDFACYHTFGNDDVRSQFQNITFMGQATYSTISQARMGAEIEIKNIQIAGVVGPEMVRLGTVIVQTSNVYSNAVKSRIRSTSDGFDYIDWRHTELVAGGGSVPVNPKFADADFRIFDEVDTTKELAFNVDAISTSTVRTATWKDEDGTVAFLADVGEVNSASNAGTGGVGVFDNKNGVDLEMRNVVAGSERVSVSLDVPNKNVVVDTVVATTTDVDLYVDDATGDDENDGSIGSPVKTISEALGRLPQDIWHSVTVRVAAGTYSAWPEQIRHNYFNSGKLRIDGSGAAPTVLSGSHTITGITDFGLYQSFTIASDIVDSGASWTPNAFIGDYVKLTSGAAIGALLPIRSNTATAVRTFGNWVGFATTDTFEIVTPSVVVNLTGSTQTEGNGSFVAFSSPDAPTFPSFGMAGIHFETSSASSIQFVRMGMITSFISVNRSDAMGSVLFSDTRLNVDYPDSAWPAFDFETTASMPAWMRDFGRAFSCSATAAGFFREIASVYSALSFLCIDRGYLIEAGENETSYCVLGSVEAYRNSSLLAYSLYIEDTGETSMILYNGYTYMEGLYSGGGRRIVLAHGCHARFRNVSGVAFSDDYSVIISNMAKLYVSHPAEGLPIGAIGAYNYDDGNRAVHVTWPTGNGDATNNLAGSFVSATPITPQIAVTGESESFIYTDDTNKVVGPLSAIPANVLSVDLNIISGILQDYSVDYTVREVIGGSAPGYYVCIATDSTAPGAGSFSGGVNPGTGIISVLLTGDKVRATYPTFQ